VCVLRSRNRAATEYQLQQSCNRAVCCENSDQVVGIGAKIEETKSYSTLSTTATLQIRTNADTAAGPHLLDNNENTAYIYICI
jgi:hypothetical protein